MLLAAHPALAQSPPTLAKAFGAASILIGQTTSLTFTITNPNVGTTLTGINFSDFFPAGLIVATPNGHTSTCAGAAFNDGAGGSAVFINSVTLGPGASCTWKVDVVATSAGTKDNTTSTIASTESSPGSPASASLTVPSPAAPTVSKTFGAASALIGQTISLTFTISNPNPTFTTLTGINFSDFFPAGLVVATPNGHTSTCAGAAFNDGAGGSAVFINSVTLGPGASCTWKVDVVATSAGTKDNTTSTIASTESSPGSPASASLAVPSPAAPTVSKAFGAASIPLGQTTTLTFTINNPNPTDTTLTGINFGDFFPAGLIVATPNGHTSTCAGAAFNDGAGGSVVFINSVTLGPGASCTWKVDVVATSAGTKNNTTDPIASNQSPNGSPASASLDVIGTPVLMSAASRKTHGVAGTFDLALSLVAPPAINHNPSTEPRTGPAQTIVFQFDKPVISGNAVVTEGVAAAGAPTFSGNEMIVHLTGVSNKQYVTVDVSSVASADGGIGGIGSARIGLLVGNVTMSRQVLPSDVGIVRSHQLENVGPTNFLYSVTLGSKVLPADVGLARANQLNSLPAP
jgi:uncharacterized repeat protein (TIGR01451 family)